MHDGWGNRALSMTLVDALNAYALRQAYAQPRLVCRLLSEAAEQTLACATRGAVDCADARAQQSRSRLALYRCSAALGTRNARYERIPASAERLAKALATMSDGRIDAHEARSAATRAELETPSITTSAPMVAPPAASAM
jgi:hypothetical protein